MANKRIEMTNLRHIIRLKMKGQSNRSIAKQLGMGRQTVDNYVRWMKQLERSYEDLYALSEEELAQLLPPTVKQLSSKYEVLSAKLSYYTKELRHPGATYRYLWEEYRQEHPEGYRYSQFCYHLSAYFKSKDISMRQEHKYGDKLFVDYCGKKLHLTDRVTGELIPVEVYVAILGGSQYLYAEASESQQLEDFLGSTANALTFLGGVPQAIVSDNLKSAVTVADNYEPQINRNFQAFGHHYNTTVLPARARKPKDKPLVEGAVKMVYRHIFFPLRNMTFFSLEDLNRAIRQQLEKLNARLFQGLDYGRRDLFNQYERPVLQALARERFEMRIYRSARVSKDTHVHFKDDHHYYSVPYQYKGKRVQIQATHAVVEIYHKHQRIATHHRNRQAGGFTTKEEHLPPNIRFVRNWSVDFFLEKAQKIGPHAVTFFQGLFEVKTHPEQAYKACMGILALRKAYAVQRIEQACRRAQFFDNFSYKAVKTILEKGLDLVDWQCGPASDVQPLMTESDPNIRGGHYFK